MVLLHIFLKHKIGYWTSLS